MTVYTYAQLEGLWINAGGPPSLAPLMAAIAEAESSGNSNAYNSSGATGLWQILGAVNPADQANLTNPQTNAKEAVLKYKSQGLSAWVTYTSGAYKQFMNNSTTPDTSGLLSSGGTTLDSSTTSAQAAACLITAPSIGALGITLSKGGCMVSKTQGRAVLGVLLMVAGGSLALPGIILLGAFAFRRAGTGAARETVEVLERTPVYGQAIRAAGRRGERRRAAGAGAATGG